MTIDQLTDDQLKMFFAALDQEAEGEGMFPIPSPENIEAEFIEPYADYTREQLLQDLEMHELKSTDSFEMVEEKCGEDCAKLLKEISEYSPSMDMD